jgi:hypothetical protein
MSRPIALPFTITRGTDAYNRDGITSIVETVHGLLRVDGETLHVQWRLHRATDQYGKQTRSDVEVEPVREVAIPLGELTDAAVRRPWWAWRGGARLILTAWSLEAFAALAGPDGLSLPHPAQLELRIRGDDRAAALDFAADLRLALAERAMRLASGPAAVDRLPPSRPAE